MTNTPLLDFIMNLIRHAKMTNEDGYVTFGNYVLLIDDTLEQLVDGLDIEWDTDTTGELYLRVSMDQADIMVERAEMMKL